MKSAAFWALLAINAIWERLPSWVRVKISVRPDGRLTTARKTAALRAYCALMLPALRWTRPTLFEGKAAA